MAAKQADGLQFKISAAEFYYVNRKTICAMFSAIVTYVIVLGQFRSC